MLGNFLFETRLTSSKAGRSEASFFGRFIKPHLIRAWTLYCALICALFEPNGEVIDDHVLGKLNSSIHPELHQIKLNGCVQIQGQRCGIQLESDLNYHLVSMGYPDYPKNQSSNTLRKQSRTS